SPRFRPDTSGAAEVQVEFRLAETEPGEGLIEVDTPDRRFKIYLHPDPLVTNKDITEARVVADEFGEPAIDVMFAAAVHQKLRDATKAHLGKPLAILVDGKVVTAPVLRFYFGTGARIHGQFARQEAERIARSLAGQKR